MDRSQQLGLVELGDEELTGIEGGSWREVGGGLIGAGMMVGGVAITGGAALGVYALAAACGYIGGYLTTDD